MSARSITRAAVAVALSGLLTACSPDAVPTRTTDDAGVAAQASPLDSSVGSPEEPAPLAAGRYTIPFIGASDDAPWAEIDVPDGWGHDRLHPATGPDLDPHLRRIELFTVARVAADPCRSSTDPIGPGVDDLMTALATQRTVRPEQPRPVSIGGYDGQQMHVRVPLDLDVTRCQLGGGLVPLTLPGGANATVFPGWSYRVWALDVVGERLVILAAQGPQVTAPERAELATMVETLRFVDAPAS
jgi:hypothetical protein